MSRRPPDPLVYYLDANLDGPELVGALRDRGRRRVERDAWSSAGAIVIMLRGEKLSATDMATALLGAHAGGRLDNYLHKRRPPMIVYLNPDGTLRVHLGGERRGGTKR